MNQWFNDLLVINSFVATYWCTQVLFWLEVHKNNDKKDLNIYAFKKYIWNIIIYLKKYYRSLNM